MSPLRPELFHEADGVEVWRVLGTASAAQLAELHDLLTEDERARAARYAVESAREAFIVSRGSLRHLLAPHVGVRPEALRFDYGEHGKPRLGGPQADSEVRFNVSHSGRAFLFALSRGRELGVDVEALRPVAKLEAMARRYFSPREAAKLIHDVPADERLASFFRCWTRKEAYLKAKGAGLSFPLDRFEVTFLAGEEPALVSTELAGDSPSDWRVTDLDVHADIVASLFVQR